MAIVPPCPEDVLQLCKGGKHNRLLELLLASDVSKDGNIPSFVALLGKHEGCLADLLVTASDC